MSKRKGILFLTVMVTGISFLIKLLGLIKQSVLAAYCGATLETDAFFIATGILVSLCIVVFSALSISLLTIHTDVLVKEGRDKANELINAVLRVFIPVSLGLSLLFFLGAPLAAKLFAPSYTGEKLTVLTHYIRLMSISFVLWCYFLTVNVVLETDKIFLPGKGQGLFLNLFLIFGAVTLYPKYGIEVLIYAFLLSALAECILVTWCARKRFKFIFGRINSYANVKKLIIAAIPLILGSAMSEINDIVDKQISSGIGAGNVSILTYGATINEIVTGVIVSSVSTVLFSHFATWVAQGEIDKVEVNLKRTLEYLTIIILPIMVMCLGAGDQIVEILYKRGNFGANEVRLTYGVVIGYAVGFIFQSARANLVKVYYAFQDTKTPMINGAIAVGTNIVLSIILSNFVGSAGIALATSIAMCLVTVLLLAGIKKYLPDFSLKSSLKECGKGLVASVVVVVVLLLMRRYLIWGTLLSFIIEGGAVGVLYVGILYMLKADSIQVVRSRMMRVLHRN